MEMLLSGLRSVTRHDALLDSLQIVLRPPANAADYSLVEIVCPSFFSKQWLQERLSIELAPPSLTDKPYTLYTWPQWLSLHQLHPPFPTSVEDCLPSNIHLVFYEPSAFPDWLQPHLASWQESSPKITLVSQTPKTPQRWKLQEDNPMQEERAILGFIKAMTEQDIRLSDIWIVTTNQNSRKTWLHTLQLEGIPVWGDPPVDLAQEFHGLIKVLEWAETSFQQNLLSAQAAFESDSGKPLGLATFRAYREYFPEGGTWQDIARYPNIRAICDTLGSFLQAFQHELSATSFLKHLICGKTLPQASSRLRYILFLAWQNLQHEMELDTAFLPLSQLRAYLEKQKPRFLFHPYRPGVRLLAMEDAQGISGTVLILPHVERYFLGDTATERDIHRLNHLANCFDVVLGTYTSESVLWTTQERVEDYLSPWASTSIAPTSSLNPLGFWALQSSLWLQHHPDQSLPLPLPEEGLRVSPSGIETFLRCPRKFFYQHLLGLYDTQMSPQAALGTLTHRILEVFNRNFQQEYTLEKLLMLTEQVFQDATQEALGILGFKPSDFKELNQLGALQKQQLKKDMLSAFKDLAASGYFDTPFASLSVEETLKYTTPHELEGIRLEGRADLIREHPDGSLEIIDYKTSRSKYTAVRLETNMRPLLNALEPIDWEAPEFQHREYQLPLYWLMAQTQPQFNDRPTQTSIQMVRPPQAFQKTGGCSTFGMTHEQLEAGKPHVLDMLINGIARPLKTQAFFRPLGNPKTDCGYCSFLFLCEGPEDGEDFGGEGE